MISGRWAEYTGAKPFLKIWIFYAEYAKRGVLLATSLYVLRRRDHNLETFYKKETFLRRAIILVRYRGGGTFARFSQKRWRLRIAIARKRGPLLELETE